KIRTGPPHDDAADVAASRAWAGVLPLSAPHWGAPVPCPQLPANTPVPPHIAHRPAPGVASNGGRWRPGRADPGQ
ncbi:MAG: hypothetical protein WCC38_16245, partial [Pseudonocardiaceae bacterium]